MLNLLSITDSKKLLHDTDLPDRYPGRRAEQRLISYCGKGKLLNGTVTLYTLKFQVKPGTLAGNTTLDFVDGTAFFAPTPLEPATSFTRAAWRDVTVSIYDPASTTFNLSAQILLQGRSDQQRYLHEPWRRRREMRDR